MNKKQAETAREWTITRNATGDVLLSVFHSDSLRTYLNGKAQETDLIFSQKQAGNLADELRESGASAAGFVSLWWTTGK